MNLWGLGPLPRQVLLCARTLMLAGDHTDKGFGWCGPGFGRYRRQYSTTRRGHGGSRPNSNSLLEHNSLTGCRQTIGLVGLGGYRATTQLRDRALSSGLGQRSVRVFGAVIGQVSRVTQVTVGVAVVSPGRKFPSTVRSPRV